MLHQRRTVLKSLAGLTLGAVIVPRLDPHFLKEIEHAVQSRSGASPGEIARDEGFWLNVQEAFHISPGFINLENGYFSPSPDSVLNAQLENIRMINGIPSFYMRRRQTEEREAVKKQLADFAGCLPEELVITRNATESLDTIISGLDLKSGDEAVMTNQDYGSMLEAFSQQTRRFGVRAVVIPIPLHPSSSREIVDAFAAAITPRTRVMLVTHMIHLTGQILPAREICDMAHAHGVDVIVDAAHSFAHIEFRIPDLHCDYLGASLHKWLCAPLGTGLLHIRKDKIKNVWPLFGDGQYPADDIRKLEHIGTHPVSSELAIADTIKFHNSLGSQRKEQRLRYLKNYWVERVKDLPKFILNTPMRDDQSCGIANFSIAGKSPQDIADTLFDKYHIFTVAIDTEAVKGVRVTPHIYTRLAHLDSLVSAIRELNRS